LAAKQFADAVDDEVVGAGLGVHALVTGLAERGTNTFNEHNFTQSAGHGSLPWGEQ
jgi:hypothetical protein